MVRLHKSVTSISNVRQSQSSICERCTLMYATAPSGFWMYNPVTLLTSMVRVAYAYNLQLYMWIFSSRRKMKLFCKQAYWYFSWQKHAFSCMFYNVAVLLQFMTLKCMLCLTFIQIPCVLLYKDLYRKLRLRTISHRGRVYQRRYALLAQRQMYSLYIDRWYA